MALRWAPVALLLWALALSVAAQVPGLPRGKPASAPAAQQAADPLGRSTPRGTVVGFIRAAARNDFESASRYLQLGDGQRKDGPALARSMKPLLDRHYAQPVTGISDEPGGTLDDGLPADRERIGHLLVDDEKVDVMLVRVNDPQAGQVWLFAAETLARVPALQALSDRTWIERVMPASLLAGSLLGLTPAHWIVMALSLVVPLVVLALASSAAMAVARRMVPDPDRRQVLESAYAALRWPAILVLSLGLHLAAGPLFGFPLSFRVVYARVVMVPLVIAVAWLARRVLSLALARARSIVWGKDRTSMQSLLLLGERLLNAVIVVVALLAILSIAGIDTQTALAGLGIGGVALALGARKTVENLLGGIFLLTDRALAVGDFCSISNRQGTVEDITLRSVRLRTPDNTLVSVPAGVLSGESIENYATREKILARTRLRLRYGTSVEQLRRILGGIRRVLEAHPRLERESARIRLVDFGERAVELELFCHVLTSDATEFLAVREELLLEVAGIVEAAGSGFAQPTEFIYMNDSGEITAPGRPPAAREAAGARVRGQAAVSPP
jgi:MscS family membrane protein